VQRKIQVVIDWPNGAGILGGKGYKLFFKWAKNFNNYHPDTTDDTFQPQGYHPIGFQTKRYDERGSRLNEFGQ